METNNTQQVTAQINYAVGMKTKWVEKTFPSQAAMDKWLEKKEVIEVRIAR